MVTLTVRTENIIKICVQCIKKIVKCLVNDSKVFCQKRVKHNIRPGWNEYVPKLHAEAKEAFNNWVTSGKARHGPECNRKKLVNVRFKYAVRFIKINEDSMRSNSKAKKLQQKNTYILEGSQSY